MMSGNTRERRTKILAEIKTIGGLPSIAVKVRQMAADPEVDFKQLGEVIGYDPSITANILGVANMGRAADAGHIYSIKDAIVRLGTRRVLKIVIGLALAPVMKTSVEGYGMAGGELWKHCVAVAMCAEKLASKTGLQAPEHCFTAGLLHDIGKIAIGSQIAEAEQRAIYDLVEGRKLAYNEAEMQVLGTDHAEIGAEILDRWELPDEFSRAVRHHHEPEKPASDDASVLLIHVADLLCLSAGLGIGSDGLNYKLAGELVEPLKLSHNIIESAVCETTIDLERFDVEA